MKAYKGLWYTPTNPNAKHSGILTISDQNDIELELISDGKNLQIQEISSHLVLGDCLEDGKFTLINYSKLRGIQTGNGISHLKLSYNHAIHGKKYETKEKIKIDKAYLRFNSITEWAVHETFKLSEMNKFIKKELYDSQDFSINMIIKEVSNYNKFPAKKIIEKSIVIEFVYSKPKNIFDVKTDAKYFSYFISLFTQQHTTINSMKYVDYTSKIPKNIEFITSDNSFSRNDSYKERDFLLLFDKIADKADSILGYWYENRKQLEPLAELLMSVYDIHATNERGIFMNVVAAVESYHRAFIRDTDEASIEKFTTIKNLIEEKELKQWFQNKNIILRSVSLPQRLVEICKIDKFNLVENVNKFKRVTANTRNMIAHNLPKGSKIGDEFEMYLIRRILKVLLELHIFTSMGIDIDTLVERYHKKKIIQEIIFMKKINNFNDY